MAKSYSQRKRDKLDYRTEYFKHNPGLFGCIWSCAYCHKPLLGKANVEVDHIIPLNSPLGRNARYNLVAACHDCNRSKSDTLDMRSVQGYFSKLAEVAVFSAQKLIGLGMAVVWWAALNLASLPFKIFGSALRSGSTFIILAIVVIIIGITIFN